MEDGSTLSWPSILNLEVGRFTETLTPSGTWGLHPEKTVEYSSVVWVLLEKQKHNSQRYAVDLRMSLKYVVRTRTGSQYAAGLRTCNAV